jgi:hypothetical protein
MIQLRDVWMDMVKETGSNRVNVLQWLTKMTLDVIGLAGFNYHFNSLNNNGERNELNEAFEALFKTQDTLPILPIIASLIPALRVLVRLSVMGIFKLHSSSPTALG